MDVERNRRKIREGTVVSNKMQNTVIVSVSRVCSHPQYGKVITRRKKYYAHHEGDEKLQVGDRVKIMETRPLSKTKRWRVVPS